MLPHGDAVGTASALAQHGVSLGRSLIRVQELLSIRAIALRRLAHNPHQRGKRVFGPLAELHHSLFPLLDLCQKPGP